MMHGPVRRRTLSAPLSCKVVSVLQSQDKRLRRTFVFVANVIDLNIQKFHEDRIVLAAAIAAGFLSIDANAAPMGASLKAPGDFVENAALSWRCGKKNRRPGARSATAASSRNGNGARAAHRCRSLIPPVSLPSIAHKRRGRVRDGSRNTHRLFQPRAPLSKKEGP